MQEGNKFRVRLFDVPCEIGFVQLRIEVKALVMKVIILKTQMENDVDHSGGPVILAIFSK